MKIDLVVVNKHNKVHVCNAFTVLIEIFFLFFLFFYDKLIGMFY